MKKIGLLLVIATLGLLQCTPPKGILPQKPPLARVETVTDNYFGKLVEDPYRYMENLEDTNVINWMKAQSEYSRTLLDMLPGRKDLLDKMAEFDKRESSRVRQPKITDSDICFYLKTTPEDEMWKLYYRKGFEGEEQLLFDPETYDQESGQKYVISNFYPSWDGGKVAIEVSPNGSENGVLMVLNVKTKEFYPEKIDRCWGAESNWLEGNESFLYSRLKSADIHQEDRLFDQKVYLHKLGTDPAEDIEIFSREKYPDLEITNANFLVVIYHKDLDYIIGALFTVDNRWNAYYAPKEELMMDKINWKRLFKLEDNVVGIRPVKDAIYCKSQDNAPNFKIIQVDMTNPGVDRAKVIVEEPKDAIIDDFTVTSDGLYYSLAKSGVQEDLYFLPFGKTQAMNLELPKPAGSLMLSQKDFLFSDIWVNIAGWTTDFTRYRYDHTTGSFTSEQLSHIAEYPEYENLVVEEVEVPSHDGVMVPLSIIYKKGTKMDGSSPLFVLGYGSYGYPINPGFSPGFFLWTYKGGIMAIAHVRGGGEKGDAWHKGGQKVTKPNTWKDLIACAGYLIDNNYTSSGKLAISGGSAGGILVGRAMTERPDLFAAVIPEVGSMNPLRMVYSPGGPVNIPEFGDPADSTECMALIEMDSYLQVKDGVNYPATMVTAGMNDPRVIAWSPAKFAARLMAANASDEEILFLADFEAGHGIGDSKTKSWESLANLLSFAFWRTGHPDFQLE